MRCWLWDVYEEIEIISVISLSVDVRFNSPKNCAGDDVSESLIRSSWSVNRSFHRVELLTNVDEAHVIRLTAIDESDLHSPMRNKNEENHGYLPASIARLPICSPTSNIRSSMSASHIYLFSFSLVETTRSEIRQLSSEQRKGTLTMRIDLKLTLSRWTSTSRGDKQEQWQQMCVYTVVWPWPILIRYRRCWFERTILREFLFNNEQQDFEAVTLDRQGQRERNAIIAVFFIIWN